MIKLILRVAMYFLILVVSASLFHGIEGATLAFLLLALVLALANGIIRPFLTLIALPFNLLTFGIASVFVNMLTLLIADAIVTTASIGGFWLMLVVSVVIMLADTFIRWLRFNRWKAAE